MIRMRRHRPDRPSKLAVEMQSTLASVATSLAAISHRLPWPDLAQTTEEYVADHQPATEVIDGL
jgi:hypothetical protein